MNSSGLILYTGNFPLKEHFKPLKGLKNLPPAPLGRFWLLENTQWWRQTFIIACAVVTIGMN